MMFNFSAGECREKERQLGKEGAGNAAPCSNSHIYSADSVHRINPLSCSFASAGGPPVRERNAIITLRIDYFF